LPWVIPGNGNKPLGSANPVRIGPDARSAFARKAQQPGYENRHEKARPA